MAPENPATRRTGLAINKPGQLPSEEPQVPIQFRSVIAEDLNAFEIVAFEQQQRVADGGDDRNAEAKTRQRRRSFITTTAGSGAGFMNLLINTGQEHRWVTQGGTVPYTARERTDTNTEAEAGEPDEVILNVYSNARAKQVNGADVQRELDAFGHCRVVKVTEVMTRPRKDGATERDQTPSGWAADSIGKVFPHEYAIAQWNIPVDDAIIEAEIQGLLTEHGSFLEYATNNPQDADAQSRAGGIVEYLDSLTRGLNTERRMVPITIVAAKSENAAMELAGLLEQTVADLPSHVASVSQEYGSIDEAFTAGLDDNDVSIGVPRDTIDSVMQREPDDDRWGWPQIPRHPWSENNAPEVQNLPDGRRMTPGKIKLANGELGDDLIIDANTTADGTVVVGSTDAGKTFLEIAWGIEYLLAEGKYPDQRRSLVMMTSKRRKAGEMDPAQIFANALQARAPDTNFTVARLVLGDLDAPPVGGDMMNPQGANYPEYMAAVLEAVAKSFDIGSEKTEGMVGETVMRYIIEAARGKRGKYKGLAHEFGREKRTGDELVAGSDPEFWTMLDLIDGVLTAIEDQGYTKGTETAEVGPWTASITERKAMGDLEYFNAGAPISLDRVLGNEEGGPDVLFIDASALEEPAYALFMAVWTIRSALWLYDHKNEAALIFDEANKLFGNDVLVKRLAEMTETIREGGGSVLYGVQTMELARRIESNLGTLFAMRTQGENLQALERFAGAWTMTPDRTAGVKRLKQREFVLVRGGEPVMAVTTDLSDYIDPDRPQAEVLGPRSYVAEKDWKWDFSTRDRIILDNEFLEDDCGLALRALVENIVIFSGAGLTNLPVSLNADLAEMVERYAADFDGPDSENRLDYHIKRAVALAVVRRTQFFNKLAPELSIPDVMRAMEEKVYNALAGNDADTTFDKTFMNRAFQGVEARAFITDKLLEAERKEQEDAKKEKRPARLIPELNKEMPPFSAEKLGMAVEGEHPTEQFINIFVPDMGRFVFANDPLSKGSIIETTVGMTIEEAIIKGQWALWDKRFQKLYNQEIVATPDVKHYLYNLVNEEKKKIENELRASRPQLFQTQPAQPEATISQPSQPGDVPTEVFTALMREANANALESTATAKALLVLLGQHLPAKAGPDEGEAPIQRPPAN